MTNRSLFGFWLVWSLTIIPYFLRFVFFYLSIVPKQMAKYLNSFGKEILVILPSDGAVPRRLFKTANEFPVAPSFSEGVTPLLKMRFL